MQPKFQYKSRKCYIFWVCVSILRYSAWNTHAPYCHLWSFRLYRIFPHYIINGNISGKKKQLLNITRALIIFYNFCLKHLPFEEELSELWSKAYNGLHVFLSDFNETWFCRQIFLKLLKYHISRKSVQCGPSMRNDVQTDEQTDMTQLIVAIRNSANARNKIQSHYPSARRDAAVNCEADYRNNTPYKSSN